MNMLNHFNAFMKKAGFPAEAEEYLSASANTLLSLCEKDIKHTIEALYQGGVAATVNERNAMAEKTGLSIYTVNFIFLVFASERMLADFRKKSISDELFWDTIMDLKYKADECKNVKGVWGTFVEFWYDIFFRLDLYKLGRLEFERYRYSGEPYTWGGIAVNKGDTVYGVHIPSCGSLKKELRMDSYKRAYDFFYEERGGGPLVLTCHSWLLYGDNRKIFPAHLNMVDFMNDWDLIKSEDSDEFHDAWRIFSRDFDGDVSKLPQETTQQKAMAKWLESGGKTGEGFGILIFDGEKIINH